MRRSDGKEHRERVLELNKELEDDWDGEGSLKPSFHATAQVTFMITLMEEVFDQDIMDTFFVVPGSGGYVIESFDPTVEKPYIGQDGDVYDSIHIPMSAFDTSINADGTFTLWYAENFYYKDKKLHIDFEHKTDEEGAEPTTLITWKEYAERYQNHMRGKIDAHTE